MTQRIVLECDDIDYQDIKRVIAMIERSPGGVADGESNFDGAAVAEICRGYEEFMDAVGREVSP